MSPKRQLANARQEVRNLQAMIKRPRQSGEKLELLRNLERSARAEVKLLEKHIDWVAKGRPIYHKLGHPTGVSSHKEIQDILAQRDADPESAARLEAHLNLLAQGVHQSEAVGPKRPKGNSMRGSN